MKVNRFVVHELVKGGKKEIAKDLLDLNQEVVAKLAEDIIDIYSKKSAVIWGRFREDERFPRDLKSFSVIDSDEEFLKISESSMDTLSRNMAGTVGTGGFICYVQYESQAKNRFLVAMVKNTEGIRLKDLKPEIDIHVDTSKLHQAISINIDGFVENYQKDGAVESYLGFVSIKGEPSGYFQDSFSCINNVTPAIAVGKTNGAVCKFLSEIGLEKNKISEARSRLFSYFKENVGKTVTLQKINDLVNSFIPEEMPDKRDGFIEFSKDDEWQIPDHFQAIKGAVDRLTRIGMSNEFVDFKFDRNSLGLKGRDGEKYVMYDEVKKQIVITKVSDELVIDIIKELDLDAE